MRVQLLVDDVQKLAITDASAQALSGSGKAGMFDYQGAGAAFDDFTVTQP